MTRYIFFSVLALGLFWGLYRLLLSRDRRLTLSRVYLLITLLFSLTYPLFRLPEIPDFTMREFVASQLDPVEVTPVSMPNANMVESPETPAMSWFLVVYVVGAVLSALPFIINALKVAWWLHRLPYERRGGIKLTLLDDETAPFSFFNHIVIGRKGLSETELCGIITHETLHARQWHSLDVIFVRACCCAAWFNPFVWLYLRDLKAVHEFLADEAATASGGREGYFQLLFRQVTGFGYGHITNNFQSINIKKRIEMMKNKKSRFGAWKMLAVLPVAALLMVVGCKNAYSAIPSATLQGRTLLTVTYSRADGKRLPFGGVGYNKVRSEWDTRTLANVKVSCSGQGGERSYGTWEISEFQTSKGLVDGKVLNRYEKRLLKAIDRELLHNGKSSGSISYITNAKAEQGRVYLSFTATWHNGKPNGDADITMTVMENAVDTDLPSNSEIYDVPDTDPEFVGGIDSLYSYLARNIIYPEQAKNAGVQGRVFVRFVIEADGGIVDAKVVRGIGSGCDEEALRVVNAMPKWKPGTKDGHPVRVQYYLPINFKLQ